MLCRKLAPYLIVKFRRMPVQKKVMMAVWALANQDVYRKIGNLFNTSRGGAQRTVIEVCRTIALHLKPEYIKLPSVIQCQDMSEQVLTKYGLPGVCGFIDGTHIPVKAPAWDRDSYINRKGYPSVNVLAVCDQDMRFTYVYADRAGSVHDARVLRVCPLAGMLESGTWPTGDRHILGDSAYPLLPNLLVPFRDNGYLTPTQRRFNAIHSSARCIVERAFGRLKGKFRRLKGIDATTLSNALYMIEAAFTLHNVILDEEGSGDGDGDDSGDISEAEAAAECLPAVSMSSSAVRQQAKQKRDRIAALL
jgi:DDE superfamily endonuclease